MDELPRRLARDPAGAVHADAPVERERDLVRDEGPATRDPRPPLLDLLAAAKRELAFVELGLDAGVAEPLEAASVLEVWIALTNDNARHPGCEERVDAGGRRAVMGARLEGHVHGGAARLLA